MRLSSGEPSNEPLDKSKSSGEFSGPDCPADRPEFRERES
jgi:hypothetical protein